MFRTIIASAFLSALCVSALHAQPSVTSPHQQIAAAGEPLAAVTRADIKVGEEVKDQSGRTVGTVKRVTSGGAVISTGKNRAEVPFAGIRRARSGLVTSVTKAEIDELDKEPRFEDMPEASTMPEM